jgi:hypothetical protein
MNINAAMMYYALCEAHIQVLNELKGTVLYHSKEVKLMEELQKRFETKIEELNRMRNVKGVDNDTFFNAYDTIHGIADDFVFLVKEDIAMTGAILKATRAGEVKEV